ncbi:MAG: hypothetical protein CMH54_02455 [Myxococcales bacterium]|nr:hypothetical protein [Myxococcales bacterium]
MTILVSFNEAIFNMVQGGARPAILGVLMCRVTYFVSSCLVFFGFALAGCGSSSQTEDAGPGGTPCVEDSDCDDQNSCTENICGANGFCEQTILVDQPCDDEAACTVGDTCNAGGDCIGVVLNAGDPCSDGDCCTTDDRCMECAPGESCDTQLVCKGEPICEDESCITKTCSCDETGHTCHPTNIEDGTACTITIGNCTADYCEDGVCTEGPSFLDDGNDCTDDLCDTKTDQALHVPNEATCEDGNPCTLDDSCAASSCHSGTLKPCDDNDPCTVDSCNEDDGTCQHIPSPEGTDCDDGNACTDNDECTLVPPEEEGSTEPASLLCLGSVSNCDDDNSCTIDSCDPDTGCVNAALPNDTNCKYDENPCVEGLCEDGFCSNKTNNAEEGTPCDDENNCTLSDICFNGVCLGQDNICEEDILALANGPVTTVRGTSLGFGRYVLHWNEGNVDRYRISDRFGTRMNNVGTLNAGAFFSAETWQPGQCAANAIGEFVLIMSGERTYHGSSSGVAKVSLAAEQYDFGGYTTAGPESIFIYEVEGEPEVAKIETFNGEIIPVSQTGFAVIEGANLVGATANSPTSGDVRYTLLSDLQPLTSVDLIPASEISTVAHFDVSAFPNNNNTFEGGYVIAWVSADGKEVRARRYEKANLEEDYGVIANAPADSSFTSVRIGAINEAVDVLVAAGWSADDGSQHGADVYQLLNGALTGTTYPLGEVGSNALTITSIGNFDGLEPGFVVLYDHPDGDSIGSAVRANIFNLADTMLSKDPDMIINAVPEGNQHQGTAIVLPDSNDRWVAAFAEGNTVWTRTFHRDGEHDAGRPEKHLYASVNVERSNPNGARTDNGNIMIVYIPKNQDRIAAKILTEDGEILVPDLTLNPPGTTAHHFPRVTAHEDTFYVAWSGAPFGQLGSRPYVRAVQSDGTFLTDPVLVWDNTIATANNAQPVVDPPTGDVFLVWDGWLCQGCINHVGIYLRRLDSDLNIVEPDVDPIEVGKQFSHNQAYPILIPLRTDTAFEGPSFFLAWRSMEATGSTQKVRVRQLDHLGQPLGESFVLNATADIAHYLAADVNPSRTEATVCWQSDEASNVNHHNIDCSRIYLGTMGVLTTETVNSNIGQPEGSPAVAHLSDSKILITWPSRDALNIAGTELDYDQHGIELQRRNASGGLVGPRQMINRTWEGDQKRPFLIPVDINNAIVGWTSTNDDETDIVLRWIPIH